MLSKDEASAGVMAINDEKACLAADAGVLAMKR